MSGIPEGWRVLAETEYFQQGDRLVRFGESTVRAPAGDYAGETVAQMRLTGDVLSRGAEYHGIGRSHVVRRIRYVDGDVQWRWADVGETATPLGGYYWYSRERAQIDAALTGDMRVDGRTADPGGDARYAIVCRVMSPQMQDVANRWRAALATRHNRAHTHQPPPPPPPTMRHEVTLHDDDRLDVTTDMVRFYYDGGGVHYWSIPGTERSESVGEYLVRAGYTDRTLYSIVRWGSDDKYARLLLALKEALTT